MAYEQKYIIEIPQKLKTILENNPGLHSAVLNAIQNFSPILQENRLYFFEEYTDHGIKHIQDLLISIEEIIAEPTFKLLSAQDVGILVLAVLLHDIGMHTSLSVFNNMITGKYDNYRIQQIDSKTWSELWEEYYNEARKFSGKQLIRIFGDSQWKISKPNLTNKNALTEGDKKLIGEFIRRHHPRIAHEIALAGIIGNDGDYIPFTDNLEIQYKELAGILARSHGMEIRGTFDYLSKFSATEWEKPYSINIIYLMVVLRVADYFQFSSTRINKTTLKIKTFSSPVSELEHTKHDAIKFIQPFKKDKETLHVEAHPPTSNIYMKLKELFKDIQYELDMSWAILGEVYGMENISDKPSIKYRRIKSNLDNDISFSRTVDYVCEKINFTTDDELPKLLIAPLYGDDPSYGVRELLQNSIDACRERAIEEDKKHNNKYQPQINVSVYSKDDNYYFQIEDNGRGMTLFELKNYFLKAGASFRKSIEWQKKYLDDDGHAIVQRSGRFGIGVLAAFLLGDVIMVTTRSIYDNETYSFSAEIDTEQLEIQKSTALFEGTRITISINKDIYDALSDKESFSEEIFIHSKRYYENSKPKWTKWYTLKNPIVYFSTDLLKNQLGYKKYNPDQNDNNLTTWNSFKTNDFENIFWSYNNEIPVELTCNGIIIPGGYEFTGRHEFDNGMNYFDTPYNERLKFGLSIKEPSVSVFDNNGVFNLNLDRNSIIDGSLPFEKELYKEIVKDLIAYLLTYTSNIKYQTSVKFSHEQLQHPSIFEKTDYGKLKSYSKLNLLYSELGYTLDINHCQFSVSKKYGINFINRNYAFSSLEVETPKPSRNTLMAFHFGDRGNIGELGNLLDTIGRVYLRKHTYGLMFDSNIKTRLRKGLKRDHLLEFDSDKWVVYSHHFNKELNLEPSVLNKIKNVDVITQLPIISNGLQSYFNELIDYYFQEDLIIPYDLEERKLKYAFAFSKLDSYIKKYQQ